MSKDKKANGRPSMYSDEVVARICDRIADGESLRTICRDEDMPCKSVVLLWLSDGKHKSFLDQYTRAREAQADALVEECLEIADDGTNDWMEKEGKDGENTGYALNGEHVQRSRLRVDTRKWWASRLAPKKYGERQSVEHSGTVTLSSLITESFGKAVAESEPAEHPTLQ